MMLQKNPSEIFGDLNIWLKSKILTVLTADKDVAQLKLRFIAAENGKWYSNLEDGLVALYKIKYGPSIRFNKHSHGYLSKSFIWKFIIWCLVISSIANFNYNLMFNILSCILVLCCPCSEINNKVLNLIAPPGPYSILILGIQMQA